MTGQVQQRHWEHVLHREPCKRLVHRLLTAFAGPRERYWRTLAVISVITYGRNDNYGYNLAKRAAISLNALAEVLDGEGDEVIGSSPPARRIIIMRPPTSTRTSFPTRSSGYVPEGRMEPVLLGSWLNHCTYTSVANSSCSTSSQRPNTSPVVNCRAPLVSRRLGSCCSRLAACSAPLPRGDRPTQAVVGASTSAASASVAPFFDSGSSAGSIALGAKRDTMAPTSINAWPMM